jgi:hypothetical protein
MEASSEEKKRRGRVGDKRQGGEELEALGR